MLLNPKKLNKTYPDKETVKPSRPHDKRALSSPPGSPGSNRGSPATRGLLLLVLSLAACTAEPESPESQIRALVARAETAAEEKDIADPARPQTHDSPYYYLN